MSRVSPRSSYVPQVYQQPARRSLSPVNRSVPYQTVQSVQQVVQQPTVTQKVYNGSSPEGQALLAKKRQLEGGGSGHYSQQQDYSQHYSQHYPQQDFVNQGQQQQQYQQVFQPQISNQHSQAIIIQDKDIQKKIEYGEGKGTNHPDKQTLVTIKSKVKYPHTGQHITKKGQKGTYSWYANDIIGKGTHGIVYKGVTENVNSKKRTVAIKVVDKSLIANVEQMMYQEMIDQQYVDKTHIMEIYDVMSDGMNCYMIEEFGNAGNLSDYLDLHKQVTELDACIIMNHICLGLEWLHRPKKGKPRSHWNLKPTNIIRVHQKGSFTWKIIDYVLMSQIKSHVDQYTRRDKIGMRIYTSPQVLIGDPFTEKVDIWGLGMIFYQILFGVCPFSNREFTTYLDSMANQKIKFYLDKTVSHETNNFIVHCLELQEKDRWSIDEVMESKINVDAQDQCYLCEKPKPLSLGMNNIKLLGEIQEEILHKKEILTKATGTQDITEYFNKFQFRSGIKNQPNDRIDADDVFTFVASLIPSVQPNSTDSLFEELNMGTKTMSFQKFYDDLTSLGYMGSANHSKKVIEDLQNVIRVQKIDLNAKFEEYDQNHDRKLTMDEFEEFVVLIFPGIAPSDIVDIFILMDEDYSGTLTLKELNSWIGMKY